MCVVVDLLLSSRFLLGQLTDVARLVYATASAMRSAADTAMVDLHCVANNPASYVGVVTVAVVWDPLASLRHYL